MTMTQRFDQLIIKCRRRRIYVKFYIILKVLTKDINLITRMHTHTQNHTYIILFRFIYMKKTKEKVLTVCSGRNYFRII